LLDRATPEPISDCARLGQGVAAAMPPHVHLHREVETGALADAGAPWTAPKNN
jgi:hypothetical protein